MRAREACAARAVESGRILPPEMARPVDAPHARFPYDMRAVIVRCSRLPEVLDLVRSGVLLDNVPTSELRSARRLVVYRASDTDSHASPSADKIARKATRCQTLSGGAAALCDARQRRPTRRRFRGGLLREHGREDEGLVSLHAPQRATTEGARAVRVEVSRGHGYVVFGRGDARGRRDARTISRDRR